MKYRLQVIAVMVCFIGLHSFAEELVCWTSESSQARLSRSNYKNDFFHLSNFYDAQENKVFCGTASASIVLNALRVRKPEWALPKDEKFLEPEDRKQLSQQGVNLFFNKYSQNNIVGSQLRQHMMGKPYAGSDECVYGLELAQLAVAMRSHQLQVKEVTVCETRLTEQLSIMKAELKQALQDQTHYVIVNYSRQALGQPGGGHFSPLGAYDQISDSFLIMDVSNTTSEWVWVNSRLLFKAMATRDQSKNRGYLLISES